MVVALVLVIAAAGAAAEAAFRPARPTAASAPSAAETTPVVLRTITSQAQVSATLGYAGSYTVTGDGGGTLTWRPATGAVIGEGGVLYRVDNGTPVFLLYGSVPAWRTLTEGLTGQDVAQLNYALVRLGYGDAGEIAALNWDYFSWETAAGLRALQAKLGLTVTGTLPLGQAVFLPSALRVTAATAALGDPASGPILTATSTSKIVTISLAAAQQTEVKTGDQVTITLPSGQNTPGVVSAIGTVATGSGSSATIPVTVTPTDPAAIGRLDEAPVEVEITAASVSDALVVPVDALLAQAGGGYAVEVVTGGRHHLVAVQLGLFDDADGLVQVTGAGLAAGQQVVVPSL